MNGKAHMTVNIVTGVALVTISVYVGLPNDAIAGIAVGAVVGTAITPDYDFEKNLPKHMIGRIPLLGYVWNLYWLPYARVVKHRSFFSHSPIASTTFRLLYLWLGVTAILYLFDLITGTSTWGYSLNLFAENGNPQFWLYLFGAWCVQDMTHLLLDTKAFRIFKRRER